jgi:hypothetical protein
VTVIEGELQFALHRLAEGASAAEGVEHFAAGLEPQGAENIVAVTVALIDRGGCGAGGFGDSTHGESFFAAAGPEPRSGLEDALFQSGIRLTGHFSSRRNKPN